TVAYALNAFVNQAGITYQSLVDQSLNLSPVSNPASWKSVSAGLAVGPNGFVGTDVGRLVRFQDQSGFWTWGKIVSIANLIPPAARYQAKYDPGSLASLAYSNVAPGAGGSFVVGDTLIGNSSGATGVLQNAPTSRVSGTLSLSNLSGNFLSGETCHCNASGAV